MFYWMHMAKRPKAADPASRPPGDGHGRDAAHAWLQSIGLQPVPRWHVEVSLEAGTSRFHLNVYAEEWGFAFHHARRSSWIRVTDIPFVHGRDDFGLLATTPDIFGIGAFVKKLEAEHQIELPRATAIVRSNIENAAPAVRRWLAR